MMRLPFWHAQRRAAVFVDYEYWYVSSIEAYHYAPALRPWREELDKQFDRLEFFFYGHFSSFPYYSELPKIRLITDNVIETWDAPSGGKKDMTDFVILDHLYQAAVKWDAPETFILFTGDGHFQPVVQYLRKLKKQVIVQGISGSMSSHLCETASQVREIIPDYGDLFHLIVDYLDEIAEANENGGQQYTTFKSLSQSVSRRCGVTQYSVEEALRVMLEQDLLRQKVMKGFQTTTKILTPQWDKLIERGLYTPKD